VSGPLRRPGAAEQAIASYLADIAGGLDGPARVRRDIMAEIAAGVGDAADAYSGAGLDPAQAARAAIDEFGSPALVAAGFRGELAAATARRATLDLMTVGLVTSTLGCVAALASHIRMPAPPWEWANLSTGLRLATLLATIAIAAAIGSHLFTLATTGRLTRWLPGRPATAAAIAAGSAAAADIAMLARLSVAAAAAPGRLAAFPLAAAGAASLAWLVIATCAARKCLVVRPTPGSVG
jgi:HAAS